MVERRTLQNGVVRFAIDAVDAHAEGQPGRVVVGGVGKLAARTGKLVVPQLFWRDHHVLGFDPTALDELATAYRASLA